MLVFRMLQLNRLRALIFIGALSVFCPAPVAAVRERLRVLGPDSVERVSNMRE